MDTATLSPPSINSVFALPTLVRDAPHLPLAPQLRELILDYADRDPIRTVTVVGNAPLAPNDERASTIDASDIVFRCNSFVLDDPGDAPCLGARTTVVVLANVAAITPYTFRDYRSRVYLVPMVGHIRKVGQRHGAPIHANWPEDLGELHIPNDGIGTALYEELAGDDYGIIAVPTTGTLAAYLANVLFPEAELNLTGFSFLDDRSQTRWRHHYGREVPVHPAHLLDYEGALLQSWVDRGRARILA